MFMTTVNGTYWCFACFNLLTTNCILYMTANHFPEHATGFQIDFLPSRLPLIFISVNYKNQLDDPKSLFKEDNKSY